MEKLFFDTEKDGFYGTYYINPKESYCAMIGMFGDDPNDYMAKCGAKWLHKNGVNVLCMSPSKKDYSHVNYPLERIETAIQWLKNNGNKNYLNIIACENAVGATAILKEEVMKVLNEEEISYMEEYIGFPNCSVDRIVPPCTNENPLDVTVENFYEWNVEEAKIKGEVPQIEGMNLVGDLIAYVERKLFTLNTGHAITAYLGSLAEYKTVDESIKDEKIATIVKAAMQESGQGLVKKHGLDLEAHYKYIDKILNRFKNPYLNDDVKRVGREPLRKLSSKDRLVNPLMTAKSYGISVDNLIIGVGAALHYDNPEDAQSVELQQTIKDLGVKEAVKKISEIEDEELLNAIETSYQKLTSKQLA